jgi:hypothetical protein
MQGVIKLEEFEKTLVKRWAEFVDTRSALTFVKNIAETKIGFTPKCKIVKLQISRFEPKTDFFLVWLESRILDQGKQVNVTIEASLDLSGNMEYCKHC